MDAPYIPTANPAAQFASHEAAIRAGLERFFSSGRYILGPEVEAFEKEFAAFSEVPHCIGVGNGTDALAIALKAVGVVAGDEVLTVSHSAVATVAAIEQMGAVPVFVDIDPVNRCLDPEKIEALVSSKARAVVVVHIYGQPAPMDRILAIAKRFGLEVIEDCAQAHGAEWQGKKVGSWGAAAAFSFYPTKNLGALGDGGAVLTTSDAVAARARSLREYGWQDRYVSAVAGLNSRLDEMQAAVLRAKLPHLARDNARRRHIAECYREALAATEILPPAAIPDSLHAMHLFVVETSQREGLQKHLQSHGIGTSLHYPLAIHQQPAYQGRICGSHLLIETERFYQRHLSLPMYPELTDAQVDRITTTLRTRPVV